MRTNCCGICQKQPQKLTDIEIDKVKTERKKMIHLFNKKTHHNNNPESNSNSHHSYHPNPTHFNQHSSNYQESTNIKQNMHQAQVIQVHRIGPLKTSRTHRKNQSYLENGNRPQPINVHSNVIFKHKKSSSLNGGARNIIPSLPNFSCISAQQKSPGIKQSAILEVHSPDPQPFSFGWEQTKNHSASLSRVDDNFTNIILPPPQSRNLQRGTNIKMGGILGKGKYSHVHMCQDQRTRFIFAIKHIFKSKQQLLSSNSINIAIRFLMQMDHPHIISCYKYIQSNEKITVFQQYTPSLLHDQIIAKEKLSIGEVRNYLKQIIEAIVILHQNNRIHGNLNPLQIGCSMGICKLRVCLTNPPNQYLDFLKDIYNIGIVGYQMAYGIRYALNSNLKDYEYFDSQQFKQMLVNQLKNKPQLSKQYSQLDDFLINLLDQRDNLRITASNSLTHPFFQAKS